MTKLQLSDYCLIDFDLAYLIDIDRTIPEVVFYFSNEAPRSLCGDEIAAFLFWLDEIAPARAGVIPVMEIWEHREKILEAKRKMADQITTQQRADDRDWSAVS